LLKRRVNILFFIEISNKIKIISKLFIFLLILLLIIYFSNKYIKLVNLL